MLPNLLYSVVSSLAVAIGAWASWGGLAIRTLSPPGFARTAEQPVSWPALAFVTLTIVLVASLLTFVSAARSRRIADVLLTTGAIISAVVCACTFLFSGFFAWLKLLGSENLADTVTAISLPIVVSMPLICICVTQFLLSGMRSRRRADAMLVAWTVAFMIVAAAFSATLLLAP